LFDYKFIGALKVIGKDRVGLVNDLTNVISKSLKTNIQSINVSSESGMFEGILTIDIDDVNQLNKAIKKLETVDGIKTVNRYE